VCIIFGRGGKLGFPFMFLVAPPKGKTTSPLLKASFILSTLKDRSLNKLPLGPWKLNCPASLTYNVITYGAIK